MRFGARWSRGRFALNVPLFTIGLAFVVGPISNFEVGGVKAVVPGAWWVRAIVVGVGVLVIVLSYLTVQPATASPTAPTPRFRTPLPEPAPDTASIGFVPDVPPRYVARPGILGAARKNLRAARSAVALVGMGGAGKTTLAAALSRDRFVRRTFTDGVVWVTVGRGVAATLIQERVAARLGGEAVSFPTVDVGRHRLAELLGSRAVLLVVDDVWDVAMLKALDVVSGRGALLFTTRDHAVARAVGARVHDVDELTLDQALNLLGKWTDTGFEDLPGVADALCLRVGRQALGIAVLGGMIKARGARRQDWQSVMDLLEDSDLTSIGDEYGPDGYQHANVLASIALSIDDLALIEQERYRELAVFASRGPFPLSAAIALWASIGYTAANAARTLTRFTDRCLVQQDARGRFLLHDLEYDVVIHQLRTEPDSLALAHCRLVDGYAAALPTDGDPADPARWAAEADDGYLFLNLAYHLARAGRSDQLDRSLSSFVWLERKLAITSIGDLLADYTHDLPHRSHIDSIHSALQLSAHILAHYPELLASQLTGRLLGIRSAEIAAMLDTIAPSDGRLWLAPRYAGGLTGAGGPLERILLAHATVHSVVVTSDGSFIVSGDDRGVAVWNLTSGRLERTIKTPPQSVRAVAVTPDGRQIVYSGRDGRVRVINLASGRLVRTLKLRTSGNGAIALTPDGKYVITPGGRYVDKVQVRNLANGRLVRTLRGHKGGVDVVAVTPDGKWIVSAGADRTVRVWDLASGRLEHTLQAHIFQGRPHTLPITSVTTTPDGTQIIVGSNDETVHIWDLAGGRLEQTLAGHTDPVSAVAVTNDGRRIVSGGSDDTVRVWDRASGRLERTLLGHTGTVASVAVTPDSRFVVSAGGSDETVRVWDLANTHLEGVQRGHTDWVNALAVTPDGTRIISGSRDRTVRVWNFAGGQDERTWEAEIGEVYALAVTPDGSHIVCGLYGTVQVLDSASGQPIRTLSGHTREVESVAVTPDGRQIVSGGSHRDRTVRIWDFASGQLERTLDTGWAKAVAVTPDGRHIVCGAENTVQIWDLAEGQLIRTLRGHDSLVYAVAVSSDGRYIVSGGSGGNAVRLWDLASGQLLHTLQGHTQEIYAVTAMADGRHVVSAGFDRAIRVWSLSDGTEVARWFTDSTPIFSCVSHPDDPRALVYGDSAGRVVTLTLRGSRTETA
ncbi:NB-ARC domain-containing protein [Nocardia amamiensis]|uniref:NB-ARC domain-containing protein n=1 Tax=Nocardia amamiensis TaxID=404578 RepID=UPI00082EB525|nr:NB-ARC domain-containing protein [Nocardia amamiensis]